VSLCNEFLQASRLCKNYREHDLNSEPISFEVLKH
jgi:hypothetical protein